MHCPSRQHAPSGCGQLKLEQSVPPWNTPPKSSQPNWTVSKQIPLGIQHAPVEQSTGSQSVPLPMYTPLERDVQIGSEMGSRQLPPRQHAPIGVGQVMAAQVVSAPMKVRP